MAKIHLSSDERPIGYRIHYNKPVWFHSAWSTIEEARKARDREIVRGRAATIVEQHLYPLDQPRPSVRYYAVYSAN